MPKIKTLTTLRNNSHLGGVVTEGSTVKVDKEYADTLVGKGYAEYVEGNENLVSTARGEYHDKFLDVDIPSDFPTEEIASILRSDNVYNFAALLSYDNFEDINGIGPKYAEEIEKGIEVAYEEWNQKVND